MDSLANELRKEAEFLDKLGSVQVNPNLLRRAADRIEALEAALRGANDMLRSAAEIARRDGRETNWPAFKARLSGVLYEQHGLMVTDHDKTCGDLACLAWNTENTASAARSESGQ